MSKPVKTINELAAMFGTSGVEFASALCHLQDWKLHPGINGTKEPMTAKAKKQMRKANKAKRKQGR